jgi:hypothetical protein
MLKLESKRTGVSIFSFFFCCSAVSPSIRSHTRRIWVYQLFRACPHLRCHLRLVRIWHSFPYYLTNGKIFLKCLLNLCFDFLYNFRLKIFGSWKNSAKYFHRCAQVSMQSDSYSCQVLTKFEYFQKKFFEKYLNIEFYENPPSRSRVVSCRRTNMTTLSLFAILRKRLKIT